MKIILAQYHYDTDLIGVTQSNDEAGVVAYMNAWLQNRLAGQPIPLRFKVYEFDPNNLELSNWLTLVYYVQVTEEQPWQGSVGALGADEEDASPSDNEDTLRERIDPYLATMMEDEQ